MINDKSVSVSVEFKRGLAHCKTTGDTRKVIRKWLQMISQARHLDQTPDSNLWPKHAKALTAVTRVGAQHSSPAH